MRDSVHERAKGFSFFVSCGDIKKHQFVGALQRIECTKFYGVTRIPDIFKVYSLYGSSVFDIKTGYDSFCQHRELIYLLPAKSLDVLVTQRSWLIPAR